MNAAGKRSFLFVDDDPHLLASLRRIFRARRDRWELSVAGSAAEALAHLETRPCDLIVTDFRMAGMSGLELLETVRERHPQVVRIVFSGEVDRDMVMASVQVAHQFIAKPCPADALIEAIEQTISLRPVLDNEALRTVVARIDTLPSLPRLYSQITAELSAPSASVRKVGAIIASDLAMTSKLLQLVNSAFFGLRQKVGSAERAVVLLGLETVKSLVLSIEIFSRLTVRKAFAPFLGELWRHSLAAGNLARKLAAAEGAPREIQDQAFMAGMLHDCGKLVLLTNFPDEMQAVLARAEAAAAGSLEAEKEVFGVTHAAVGGYLMGIWGLPAPVTAAILEHHSPGNTAETAFSALTAVHLADFLEHLPQPPPPDPPEDAGPLDSAYLAPMGWPEAWARWRGLRE